MNDITLQLLQYSASGFCCSQIMVLLGLEQQGIENPDLVRAMAGLCLGLGDCEGPCGVLTGGACLLSLYAGKGSPSEQAHDRFPLMLQTYVAWFREEMQATYGGSNCLDIVGEGRCRKPEKERCAGIMQLAFSRCMEILTDYDIDPNIPKSETYV